VKHCLDVLDGYDGRYVRMKDAQAQYTSEHRTHEFDPGDEYDSLGPVPGPKRVPSGQLTNARRELCDSFYRFLRRCHDEKLIDEFTIRKVCDPLGINIG